LSRLAPRRRSSQGNRARDRGRAGHARLPGRCRARNGQRREVAVGRLREAGVKVFGVPLDVTDDDSVSAAAGLVEDRAGRLDVLVTKRASPVAGRSCRPRSIPPWCGWRWRPAKSVSSASPTPCSRCCGVRGPHPGPGGSGLDLQRSRAPSCTVSYTPVGPARMQRACVGNRRSGAALDGTYCARRGDSPVDCD